MREGTVNLRVKFALLTLPLLLIILFFKVGLNSLYVTPCVNLEKPYYGVTEP